MLVSLLSGFLVAVRNGIQDCREVERGLTKILDRLSKNCIALRCIVKGILQICPSKSSSLVRSQMWTHYVVLTETQHRAGNHANAAFGHPVKTIRMRMQLHPRVGAQSVQIAKSWSRMTKRKYREHSQRTQTGPL
jgi:hypothetical protein